MQIPKLKHNPYPDNMYGQHLDNIEKYIHKLKDNNTNPILEFGVSQGTSIAVMAEVLKEANMSNRLIGFDSFEGLPHEEGFWNKGQFKCSLEDVKENLNRWPNIELVKGWYDQVLTDELKRLLNLTSVSLIHIDCDLYSATKTVLAWCKSLLIPGTVLLFDEWPVSEKRAWGEFVSDGTVKHSIIQDAQQGIVQIL